MSLKLNPLFCVILSVVEVRISFPMPSEFHLAWLQLLPKVWITNSSYLNKNRVLNSEN